MPMEMGWRRSRGSGAVEHHRRLLVALVVVADQMQEPMDGKMGDMMGE